MTDLTDIEVDTGYEGRIRCRVCREFFADQDLASLLEEAREHLKVCPGKRMPPVRVGDGLEAFPGYQAFLRKVYGDQLRSHLAQGSWRKRP
jgi:hypothetical protein